MNSRSAAESAWAATIIGLNIILKETLQNITTQDPDFMESAKGMDIWRKACEDMQSHSFMDLMATLSIYLFESEDNKTYGIVQENMDEEYLEPLVFSFKYEAVHKVMSKLIDHLPFNAETDNDLGQLNFILIPAIKYIQKNT